MTDRGRRSTHAAWFLLCGALAAGLAVVSLYLVGLAFLALAGFVLGVTPEEPQHRVATVVSMILGFELSMGVLALLYWFAWYQRAMAFYGFLYILAVSGFIILLVPGLVFWRQWKKI